jgi:hypothetical protein
MDTPALTAAELATLRDHGVVLHADRVIFAAQPALSEARLAEIAAVCAGPLPASLLALWRLTAGGRLAYDLTLTMHGQSEAISWCELFFDGSSGYRDLQGWIDHELELAEEAATEAGTAWSGRLDYLPIGGFEYCDRVYVVTRPGPEHGAVVAWKQGLPPAWKHRLHAPGVARVADDLAGALAALALDDDPLAPTDPYFAGAPLLDYLDERVDRHGLDPALRDRVIAAFRSAVRDWRSALAAGTLVTSPELARTALLQAITGDDGAAVTTLAAAGVDLGGPLRGSAGAVAVAVGAGAFVAASALVEAGAAVPRDVFDEVDGPLPAALATRLLAAGAEPCAADVATLVACGAADSARVLLARPRPVAAADLRGAIATLRTSLSRSLTEVQAGRLGHYLGADGLAARITRLDEFVP